MTDQNKLSDRQLDDQLAEFTDRLLNKKTTMDIHEARAQDQTLIELEETIIRLARAFENETASENVSQRIETNLLREWHKTRVEKPRETIWQRWQKRLTQSLNTRHLSRNQKTAYGLALVSVIAVVVFLFLSVFFPDFASGSTLTGTAFGEGFPIQVILVVGVILVFVYWIIRRRN